MDHSYEEIRKTAIDILAGREKLGREESSSRPQKFDTLAKDVKEVLRKRDRLPPDAMHRENLSKNDEALLQEVFWDLFRQNVITLGTQYFAKFEDLSAPHRALEFDKNERYI